MRSMKYIVPVIALSSLLAFPALAADLGQVPAAPQANDQQMEFGNSWYLRGDVGGVLENSVKISNDLNLLSDSKRHETYSYDLGFGYKFNNWLRADIFAEQRTTQVRSGIGGNYKCPTGSVLNPGGLTTSLTYSNCDVNGYGKLVHGNLLANVYVDLGNWGGFTPYVGVGAGLSHTTVTGSTWYTLQTTGTPYNPTITDPLTGVATTYKYDKSAPGKSKSQLAWNVMAGVGYALNEHAVIDLGYRYLRMGNFTGVSDRTGAVISKPLTSHEVRAGFRYMID